MLGVKHDIPAETRLADLEMQLLLQRVAAMREHNRAAEVEAGRNGGRMIKI